ncbi:PAS domain S-box-containing protein [Flavobacterium micromati]|uniref:histidine kinase n=1 Tax=Flavobacterium micromati TaxID=229205 RepID=A0A1M5JJR0_9FLAO|nr:PAS domain S-box protein [Flavobacterium micromati]SHG40761.1 PAS domain S-box-containing protein [Flavobacterium micromati]
MTSEKKQNKFIKYFFNRPKTIGLFVFLFLSFIVAVLVFQQYKLTKENDKREMSSILNVVSQNLEKSLKNCYTTTLTLALTIDDQGKPKNFETIGKKIIESNANINTVQLVPQGIIKYIYPLKGNEAAINLNILTDPYLKNEALKSIATQKMYFAGPLKLKQGGIGIVGRFPVFEKNKFWGFSAVILNLDELLKSAGITSIDSTKHYFQFSKFDFDSKKETYFLNNDINLTKNYSVSTKIPDSDWKLYLVSKKQSYFNFQIIVQAIIGVFLSALFGFLITSLLQMPKKLQSLVKIQALKILNSEIKYEVIFDQAAVGIAHIDSTTGTFIEINNQYCNLIGYTEAEMKKLNFKTITHPDDLQEEILQFEKVKKGEINHYSMEKRLISKNGEIIWTNLTVSPLLKKDKSFTNHIAIIEDISAKKETEKLIKKSEARFKSLFEDSPIPLWEEDFSGVKNYLIELNLINQNPLDVTRYLDLNPEVISNCIDLVKIINVNTMSLDLYKSKAKSEITSGLTNIIDTDAVSDFSKIIVAITQEANKVNFDTRIKTSFGEYRNVDLRWNVIKGYEKSLQRVIISTEDITDRKISEQIILQSQARLESLINTIDGIVWECDVESFNFKFISQKVTKILGYTPEEWLSNPSFWIDHIYDEDKEWVPQYCKTKTKENSNHDFEYRMIAKDGSIVWLRDIVNIVIENGIPLYLKGIMIDITKTKEAEKELNASFDLVSEQNKRLLNFSYIISHNLRSHTSNISSIISLIESAESQEEREQMLNLLKTVSCSLDETMLHLNEVINIRTNVGLSSEPLNLHQYISTVNAALGEQIRSNEVKIVNDIPQEFIITYNPAYLESILYNIISNSIRYRHSDRKPEIKISIDKEGDKKVLQISDNGIGIDLVRNADKIFGLYKTFTNNIDSKGLGLFITKNQVDAMGGMITVDSELGIGTTFKIYIR